MKFRFVFVTFLVVYFVSTFASCNSVPALDAHPEPRDVTNVEADGSTGSRIWKRHLNRHRRPIQIVHHHHHHGPRNQRPPPQKDTKVIVVVNNDNANNNNNRGRPMNNGFGMGMPQQPQGPFPSFQG